MNIFVNRLFQLFVFPSLILSSSLLGWTLVLDDFETDSSLALWQGSVESLSTEYPAHGKNCLKLNLSGRRGPILESENLARDWSGFDLLKFDIYYPGDRPGVGKMEIYDELNNDEEATWDGQYYDEENIFLVKGWNHFEFKLDTVTVLNNDRSVALDRIRRFRLILSPFRGTAYFDNLRLVKGEEGPETASKTGPWDCRVVIEDGYSYQSLYGPDEELVYSTEVRELKSRAEKEVAELKRLVDLAKIQGYQTLYWQIPLITADVGLGIRSLLVWYQSEGKQREILEYVISSCGKAARELRTILSGHERGFEVMDGQKLSYEVPPYPQFRGLRQWDGYFRDGLGAPVLALGVASIRQGPLMEFFANYNQRYATGAVGGGSRADIETSPVYEAFNKYPDTHRVGWDGWCGHLIKDRWSWGGKRENVVICIESPHIREAQVEYIRQHHNEWKDNKNILFHAMNYELQYICYCETSQRMFREWLKAKYGSIDRLNSVWGTDNRNFEQVTAPATLHAKPLPDVNRAAWYDWACFNTRRFTDYLKWTKEQVLNLDPDIPLTTGGTSSMLSASNSVSGIDEEMIINEVDDVILNESGGSLIFSDLFLSLSETRKPMVEPEYGGFINGMLLHFLHGKSSISKWWWPKTLKRAYPHVNEVSVPHSWSYSLEDVAEFLRLALDIRRLSTEIAEFTRPEPEVAILYSKSCMIQVPPDLIQAGQTPYIEAVQSTWEGSRYLGCRVGFVSEKQILAGKLSGFKLLIVPAVKYLPPEICDRILEYVDNGGTAVVVPESFLFDQYARNNDRLAELGLRVEDVTLPELVGEGEIIRNYDMSITQTLIYGEVSREIRTEDIDIFQGRQTTLHSTGLVQKIDPGSNPVLARFSDGAPAIVQARKGRGCVYYLAAPLSEEDYAAVLEPLADRLELHRPVVGVDSRGELVTVAEVRSVERKNDYLVYASNLGPRQLEFDLKANGSLGKIEDLRAMKELRNAHIELSPWEETIFRIEKDGK